MLYGFAWELLSFFITLFFLLVLPKIRQKRKKATSISDAVEWINSLGGSSNIINFSSSRSRLTLEVKDSSLVDQNKLKLLVSIIIMSQKNNFGGAAERKNREIYLILDYFSIFYNKWLLLQIAFYFFNRKSNNIIEATNHGLYNRKFFYYLESHMLQLYLKGFCFRCICE